MKSIATNKSSSFTGNLAETTKSISDAIAAARRVLVVSHIDPDGDAIGTALAFAAYCRTEGKEAVTIRHDSLPSKYDFLDGFESMRRVDDIQESEVFDTMMVLECPTIKRMGEAARFVHEDMCVINIDHHPRNKMEASLHWVDDKRSSVGEMVLEYLLAVDCEITPAMAEQLYTAIMTDTGQFRFGNTSPRTMALAGQLIGFGADPKTISDRVYYNLTPPAVRLLGPVLSTIEFHQQDRVCLLSLTQEMLQKAGATKADTEGLVDFTLYSGSVCCGALLKESEPSVTKVSLRSRDGVDVSKIASEFGGGGHVKAAGCAIPLPLEEARKELLRRFNDCEDLDHE
jgi:phosphoesterase RecJ-like protein